MRGAIGCGSILAAQTWRNTSRAAAGWGWGSGQTLAQVREWLFLVESGGGSKGLVLSGEGFEEQLLCDGWTGGNSGIKMVWWHRSMYNYKF